MKEGECSRIMCAGWTALRHYPKERNFVTVVMTTLDCCGWEEESEYVMCQDCLEDLINDNNHEICTGWYIRNTDAK